MELLHYLQTIRLNSPTWINIVFILLSESVLVLTPVVGLHVYWSVDKKKGTYILCAFAFAYLINELIKVTACIYRPWILDSTLIPAAEVLYSATNYSFPSSHSCAAASIFTSLALAFPNHRKLKFVALFFIPLVMFARMYLGCHTPVDVCCGAAIGMFCSFFFRPMLSEDFPEERFTKCLLPVCLLITVCSVFYILKKDYPLDYNADGSLIVDPATMRKDTFGSCGLFAGLGLGFAIERTRIVFSMPRTAKAAYVRSAAGVCLFGLLFLLSHLLLRLIFEPALDRFLSFFFAALFSSAIYPVMFMRRNSIT